MNLSRDDDPFWARGGAVRHARLDHVRLSGKEGLKGAMAVGALAGKGPAPQNPLDRHVDGRGGGRAEAARRDGLQWDVDRFPRLQMVFGEVNVGWVPLVLESMDDHFNRDRIWTKDRARAHAEQLLADQLRRDLHHRQVRDRNRDLIGPETILWSTDYPHPPLRLAGIPAPDRGAHGRGAGGRGGRDVRRQRGADLRDRPLLAAEQATVLQISPDRNSRRSRTGWRDGTEAAAWPGVKSRSSIVAFLLLPVFGDGCFAPLKNLVNASAIEQADDQRRGGSLVSTGSTSKGSIHRGVMHSR